MERVKRQKLRETLKRMKRAQARHDIAVYHEQLMTIRSLYESEIGRLGLVSYRGLSRLHQFLISITPASEHTEVSQLIYEFLRTIEQIKAPPKALNSNGM